MRLTYFQFSSIIPKAILIFAYHTGAPSRSHALIKAAAFPEPWMSVLDFPLGSTSKDYIVHGFTETDYLETFADNPGDIYGASSIDKAMANTYTQTRKFVMAAYGLTADEANTIITQGIDFGMTQLVDGNWGVHAIIPKAIFADESRRRALSAKPGPWRRQLEAAAAQLAHSKA